MKELENNVLYISDADMEEEDSALISRFLSSKQAHCGLKAIYLTRIVHKVSATKQRMMKKAASSHFPDFNAHRSSILAYENFKLLRAVIDCISKCHSLEALYILGVHIPAEFLTSLGNAIYENDSRLFRSLIIKNSHLRDDGFRLLTPYLAKSKIQVIALENLHLTDESCNYLASIIKAQEAAMDTLYWNSTLRIDSALDDGYATTDTYGLQALSLKGNQITSSGVMHVAKFLRSNQWLLAVNFACNQIDVDGVVHLAKALENNTTLHTVVLAGNPGYNDKIGQTLDETASVAHSKLDMRGKSEYDSYAVGEVRPCVAAIMLTWLNMDIQKELCDQLNNQKKKMGYGKGRYAPKRIGNGDARKKPAIKLEDSSSKHNPSPEVDTPSLMGVNDFELIESLDLGSVDSELRGQTKMSGNSTVNDGGSFCDEDDDEEIWRAHTKNINFQNDEVDEMLRNLFATSGDNSEDIAKMAEKSGSLYATLAQDRMGELVANDVGSSIEVESSIASDGAIVAPLPSTLSIITGACYDADRPQTSYSNRPKRNKVAPPVRSISPATLPSTLTSPTQADEQHLIDSQNIPAFAFGRASNEKNPDKKQEIKFEFDARPGTSRGSRGSNSVRLNGKSNKSHETALVLSPSSRPSSAPLLSEYGRTVTIASTKSGNKGPNSFLEKARQAAKRSTNTKNGTVNSLSKDKGPINKGKDAVTAVYLSPKALATGAVNAFKYKSILKKPAMKKNLHDPKRSMSASVDAKFAGTSSAPTTVSTSKLGFGRSVSIYNSDNRKSGTALSAATTTPRGTMTRMSARKVTSSSMSAKKAYSSSSMRVNSALSNPIGTKGKINANIETEAKAIPKRNNRLAKEYSKFGVTKEYASQYLSPQRNISSRGTTPRNSGSDSKRKTARGNGEKRSPVEEMLNNLEEGVVLKINEVTANLQEVSRQLVIATDSLSKVRESPVVMAASGVDREMNDEVILGNEEGSESEREDSEEDDLEDVRNDIDEESSQNFSLSDTVKLSFKNSPDGTRKVIGKRVTSPVNVDCRNALSNGIVSDGAREVVKIKGGEVFNLNGEKLETD